MHTALLTAGGAGCAKQTCNRLPRRHHASSITVWEVAFLSHPAPGLIPPRSPAADWQGDLVPRGGWSAASGRNTAGRPHTTPDAAAPRAETERTMCLRYSRSPVRTCRGRSEGLEWPYPPCVTHQERQTRGIDPRYMPKRGSAKEEAPPDAPDRVRRPYIPDAAAAGRR